MSGHAGELACRTRAALANPLGNSNPYCVQASRQSRQAVTEDRRSSGETEGPHQAKALIPLPSQCASPRAPRSPFSTACAPRQCPRVTSLWKTGPLWPAQDSGLPSHSTWVIIEQTRSMCVSIFNQHFRKVNQCYRALGGEDKGLPPHTPP